MFPAILPPACTGPGSLLQGPDGGYSRSVIACAKIILAPREGVNAWEAGGGMRAVLTAISCWLVAALYLEGWAHNHRRIDLPLFARADVSPAFSPPGIPTTLTTWHLPFLIGLLVTATLVISIAARSRRNGIAWSRALPPEHTWSAAGVGLVAFGIILNALFPRTPVVSIPDLAPGLPRFESLPTLLGGPNLLQALGVLLVIAAPLRTMAHLPAPPARPRLRPMLPSLISLTMIVSVLSYLTQFGHPMVDPWPEISFWRRGLQTYRYGQFYFGESMGILSVIVQTVLLMGPVLLAAHRWVLPPGSVTIIFTVNAALVSTLQDRWYFIPAAAIAGFAADVLLGKLRRSTVHLWEFRLFAFAVPALYTLLYFLALGYATTLLPPLGPSTLRLEGIGWSVQLRLGAVLVAGLVGVLLSYLIAPPRPLPTGRPSAAK